jgi:hypothetical protein
MVQLFHQGDDFSAISDAAAYAGLTAELLVTDTETGERSVLPMENTGSAFMAIYPNQAPKTYTAQAIVSGSAYYSESPRQTIPFTNTPPVVAASLLDARTLKRGETPEIFYLNEYFTDGDGDPLTYTIVAKTGESPADVKDQVLTVTPARPGDNHITIKASDGRGGEVTAEFPVTVTSFWRYHQKPILIIAGIAVVLLAAYLLLLWAAKKKRRSLTPSDEPSPMTGAKFSGGRFEGYFLSTRSGGDIPVLFWNAAYIDNKHGVTLGELFSMLDVREKLPESHKMYFEAGRDQNVIFFHNTYAVVSIGKKDVPAGKKEILRFDDRLYIVFEDNATEIEIRYIRVGRRRTA